jgi:hypothetical protein
VSTPEFDSKFLHNGTGWSCTFTHIKRFFHISNLKGSTWTPKCSSNNRDKKPLVFCTLSLFRTQHPMTATIGLACTYLLVRFPVSLQLTRPLKLNILVAHATNELPIGQLSNLPTQELETKHCCHMVSSQWWTSQIACTTSVPSSSQIRVITHPCIILCANRQPYEMRKAST